LRLGLFLRGDVLVDGDPAAVRHRPVIDRECPPVAHGVFDIIRLAAADFRQPLLDISAGVFRTVTGGNASFQDRKQCHAALHLLGWNPVHFAIALIAHDQTLVAVEHAQPVRHVLERGIEPHILRLQLGFALAQRDGTFLDELIEPAVELLELADHQRNRAVGTVAVVVGLLVGLGDECQQRLQIELAGALCRLRKLSGEELMHPQDPSPRRSS
jgi:hypothetical protein